MSFFTRTTSQRFQGKFVWKKHVTVQERMDKNFENNRCGSGGRMEKKGVSFSAYPCESA